MRGKEYFYLKKQSRLIFTEEERADPTLEKPIAKSEKVSDKVKKEKAKIAKKTVNTKQYKRSSAPYTNGTA